MKYEEIVRLVEIVRYVTEQRLLDAIDIRIFLIGENNPHSCGLRSLATQIRTHLASDISQMSEADFELIDDIRRELFS